MPDQVIFFYNFSYGQWGLLGSSHPPFQQTHYIGYMVPAARNNPRSDCKGKIRFKANFDLLPGVPLFKTDPTSLSAMGEVVPWLHRPLILSGISLVRAEPKILLMSVICN